MANVILGGKEGDSDAPFVSEYLGSEEKERPLEKVFAKYRKTGAEIEKSNAENECAANLMMPTAISETLREWLFDTLDDHTETEDGRSVR
jgi:hypothetical protein